MESIEKIKSQIENFDKNYKKIGQSADYLKLPKLMKLSGPGSENSRITRNEISKINQILLKLVDYRNDSHTFDRHKKRLSGIILQLEFYSQTVSNYKNLEYQKSKSGSSTIDPVLNPLETFNHHVDKFDKHLSYVKELQKIGERISTMKSKSNQVKDKLNPEFKNHIEDLSDIDFDYDEFHGSLTKIKSIAESLIEKLKIAKNAIDLYNSLDSETSKLTGVTFTNYDIEELKKNSNEIKKKLESFETISVPTNSNTETIPEISKTHQKYSSDVSSYQSLINYLLYEISFVIYTYRLLQIMILYSTKISEIPNKIKEIRDIDTALSTLAQIFKDLVTFYRVHNSSMNILIVFHFISFARFYINKYVYNFILVNYYTEVLIFSILCYYKILSLLKFLQVALQSIISNRLNLIPESNEIKVLRAFTSRTNRSLKSIWCNMISLKTLSDNLNVKNVKYNLDKIRTCIKEISDKRIEIKYNIYYINKGILKLYIINFKIIYIKMYVGQIIKKIISLTSNLFFYYIIFILFIEQRYIKSDGKQSVFLILSNSIFEIIKGLKKIENYDDNFIYAVLIQYFINKLVSVTNNTEMLVKKIESNIDNIDKSVLQVECAIEGVARNLIRCSLQSLSTHLIISNTSSTNVRDAEVDNRVMSMYSVMSVMDYKVVVNRLYDSAKKIDQILQLIPWPDGCRCIFGLESTTNKIDLGTLNVQKIIEEMTKENNRPKDLLKLDQIRTLIENDIKDNHVCLCMVIKYVLYPRIIDMSYGILGTDLQTLSTISRKFQKYTETRGLNVDISRFWIIIINLLDCISNWIRNNYPYAMMVDIRRVEVKCFCCYYQDRNYYVVVSTILVLSYLIENIWSKDTESLKISISCLSGLISKFDITYTDNNRTNSVQSDQPSCNSDNSTILCDTINILLCKPDVCKLSSKLQLILDFVTFCSDVPFLRPHIRPYIKHVSLSNVDMFESEINRFITMDLNSSKSYFQSLLDKYKLIDGSNNLCKQFKNQCCVLSSNIIINVSMLISVKMSSKLYPKKCEQLKERMCCFLKSICNCKDSECCIKQLIDMGGKICNGNNQCNCQELLNKCVELCCNDKCCWSGCPCKEIKSCCDKLKELCCENSGTNGLCKLIESIQKCGCKSKHPCNKNCICVCCKLAIKSILILQNMFRSNLRIISKNVIVSCKYILEITDKIKNTNYQELYLKGVIKRILDNNSRYNKLGISLVKHNCITSNSHVSTKNISVTNVETRNWGYDTKYEHDVTNDRGFTYNYPDISNNTASYGDRGSGNKQFKMILSRMLVGGVIVFVFLYLRVSYQIEKPFRYYT